MSYYDIAYCNPTLILYDVEFVCTQQRDQKKWILEPETYSHVLLRMITALFLQSTYTYIPSEASLKHDFLHTVTKGPFHLVTLHQSIQNQLGMLSRHLHHNLVEGNMSPQQVISFLPLFTLIIVPHTINSSFTKWIVESCDAYFNIQGTSRYMARPTSTFLADKG